MTVLEPPTESGGVLTSPPARSWAALAAATSKTSTDAVVEARRELFAAARRCAGDYGAPEPAETQGRGAVVVTGHQPELVHPGVWAKMLFADELAERIDDPEGASSFELVVDTDVAEDVTLRVPMLDGSPRVIAAHLVRADPKNGALPFAIPPPREDVIDGAFAEAILAAQTLPDGDRRAARLREARDECIDLCGRVPSASAFLVAARRRFERGASRSSVLPVSALARTTAFQRFVHTIADDLGRFAAIHRRELEAHRAAHRIRSRSHPIADLREGELPFWSIENGLRRPTVSGDVERMDRGEVLVVPRAITLTAFVRYMFADLFIHGTGGVRYETVSTAIFEAFFGVPARPYVVATLTLDLGGARGAVQRLAHVRDQIARAKERPAALAASVAFASAAVEPLLRERAEITGAEIARASAVRRTELRERLRAIDASLREALGPWTIELEASLPTLERDAQVEALLRDRTYPYLLFGEPSVRALVRSELGA